MNGLPQPVPHDPDSGEQSSQQAQPEALPPSSTEEAPALPPAAQRSLPVSEQQADLNEPSAQAPGPDLLFPALQQAALYRPPRFPNFADVGLLLVLLLVGWIGSGALLGIAMHYRLYGVSTMKQALNDIHYTLGAQAAWYIISFGGCVLLFPAVWHTGFFVGVEWQFCSAFRIRWRLFGAVFVCIVLAVIDGILMPGPANTPIDQIFRMPGAAWLLFGFGITLAPLCEELGFRGFLLPALCTAYDWAMEKFAHQPAPWPDENGKAQWSLPAMVVASVITSFPFALMHAEQTGYSLGPFLLLVCVSLVLCWVRLSARSLAASVIVHSSYNFLLFSVMLAGTGGFKHLERM
jgi:hypothetical protein